MATGQEERARDLKAGVVRDSAMFSDASSTVHVLHLARPLSRPNCAARMDADEVSCRRVAESYILLLTVHITVGVLQAIPLCSAHQSISPDHTTYRVP